jgi:hypothetical protein
VLSNVSWVAVTVHEPGPTNGHYLMLFTLERHSTTSFTIYKPHLTNGYCFIAVIHTWERFYHIIRNFVDYLLDLRKFYDMLIACMHLKRVVNNRKCMAKAESLLSDTIMCKNIQSSKWHYLSLQFLKRWDVVIKFPLDVQCCNVLSFVSIWLHYHISRHQNTHWVVRFPVLSSHLNLL